MMAVLKQPAHEMAVNPLGSWDQPAFELAPAPCYIRLNWYRNKDQGTQFNTSPVGQGL